MNETKSENARTGLEIAVIGMSGRFPGAKTIEEFWENLKNGVESVVFFSDEELAESGIGPKVIKNPSFIKAKGPLEDIRYFDSNFFNYTPKEANMMDPQIRIFHECAWHALENAAYDPDSYSGLIGLYAGYSPNIWWKVGNLIQGGGASARLERDTLNSYYFSTLICYKLNLKGPGVTVYTACSTSLVAIHLACRGLLTGEADLAMAGGISLGLPQISGYIYQEGMISSPDGHCRAFDVKSKGTVSGHGVGVVVLKRLVKAIKDRDHVYAVIKGTAINNDGNRKAGYTAPSVEAQAEVVRAARRMAEIPWESITYIETHGTGTPLGDPIEIEALNMAFQTEKKKFCRLSALKTNMGHMDTAAGIGGFIKVVLALNRRLIPPTLHFESPNPEINFENSPFLVNTELYDWKNDGYPLRAGLSSFGIGGTNAHVVLEEWPEDHSSNARRTAHGAKRGGEPPCSPESREYHLMLLSARTKPALDRATRNLAEYLTQNPGVSLAEISYTLQVGRKDFESRRMLLCPARDRKSVVDALLSVSSSGDPGEIHHRDYFTEKPDKPVVFMFPGLGPEYVDMGLELYQSERVFREEVDRCFDLVESLADGDIKGILYPSAARGPQAAENSGDIHRFEVAQIVVFIFEYALARLLIHWGIKPHAMIGYSFGEYTAACISGVFSPEDVLKLIMARGRLIRSVPPGGMLSVPLPAEKVTPLLNEQLSIAVDNGASCIVSGLREAVDAFEKKMKQKKYLCIRLQASHGIHSRMMDPILERFEEEIGTLTLNKPKIPYVSNVTGEWITAEDAVGPRYWAGHLRNTVRFAKGLQELIKTEDAVLVEVGPGVALSTLAVQYIDKDLDQQVVNLVRSPDQEIPDMEYLLRKTGRLWLYGKKIDWTGFYSEEKRRRVPLPGYSFDKTAYSIDVPVLNLLRGVDVSRLGSSLEKVEESALPAASPEYVQQGAGKGTAYAAPGNKAEKMMMEMWEESLGIKPIGIHDNFFEKGGDSLKGITLVNRFKEIFGEIIHVTALFDAPTPAELAAYFKKHYPQGYARLMEEEPGATEDGAAGEEGVTNEKIARFRQALSRPIPAVRFDTPKNPPAVFLLSPPRTGSTLFRVLLAGNPGLFAPPELNLLHYTTLRERKTALTGAAASHLQGALRAIMQIKHCTIEQAEEMMQQFEDQDMTVPQFYRCLQEWIEEGNRILVDKSPGYSMRLDVLKQAEAYFRDPLYIHLLRHPYGMIRSYVEAKMDLLTGQRLLDRLSVTRQELAEMIWTINVRNILEFLKDVPPERQMAIKFEDLVAAPETHLREICRFLNLQFHPEMLQPYEEKDRRMTNGVYAEGNMIGDPKFHQHKAIDPSVADTWKKDYTVDFLGETAKELAKSLGYKTIRECEREQKKNKEPGEMNIEIGRSVIEDKNLQLLRQAANGAGHLFFVHDRNGEVGGYIEFSRHLTRDFNCWGIRADQLINYTPQNLTIEELAQKYIGKIKKVQSQGPYYIAGWSFAGNIAFDMVRQLEQKGENIGALAFFDSLPPPKKDIPMFTLETEKSLAKKYLSGDEFEEKLENITDINDIWPFIVDYMESRNFDVQLVKKIIMEDEENIVPDYHGLGIGQLIGYLNVNRTFRRARERYVPPGKVYAPVHFFIPRQSKEAQNKKWDDYCHRPVSYHEIAGGHYTMLKMPAAAQFAALFCKVITADQPQKHI